MKNIKFIIAHNKCDLSDETANKKWVEELSKENNVVLDGLYSWTEYNILIEEIPELIIISVITDKNIRYERMIARKDKEEDAKRRLINDRIAFNEDNLKVIGKVENIDFEKRGNINAF